MSRGRKNRIWWVGVLWAVFWISCRGAESPKRAEEVPVPESWEWLDSLEAEVPGQGFRKEWQKYQRKQQDFETFSARAKMRYKGQGQSHEFSAQIRMKKEEAIWVSVSALGGMVSVGRAYIRPDSIRLISYLQKKAWAMPLEKAAAFLPFPVDYPMVESLILGCAMGSGDSVEARQEIRGPYFLVRGQGRGLDFMEIYERSSLHLRQSMQQSGQISFFSRMDLHDYRAVGRRWFSHYRLWAMRDGAERHSLEMEFTQPQFDEPVSLPFSIPSGFILNP